MNARKTSQGSDIPTRIIKCNVNLFSSFICHVNYCISIGEFLDELKYTEVIAVIKKRINVINATISQLVYFTVSKIYEKIIYN